MDVQKIVVKLGQSFQSYVTDAVAFKWVCSTHAIKCWLGAANEIQALLFTYILRNIQTLKYYCA